MKISLLLLIFPALLGNTENEYLLYKNNSVDSLWLGENRSRIN